MTTLRLLPASLVIVACTLVFGSIPGRGAAASEPKVATIVVLHTQPNAPSSLLSVDGSKIGEVRAPGALRFELPVGMPRRLRAGRGNRTVPGEWPVFYAELSPRAGETVYLLLELTTATSSARTEIYLGTGGVLSWPSTATAVTRGEFRSLSTTDAAKLLPGLKIKDAGLIGAK